MVRESATIASRRVAKLGHSPYATITEPTKNRPAAMAACASTVAQQRGRSPGVAAIGPGQRDIRKCEGVSSDLAAITAIGSIRGG